jgi:TolA-binding protein
MKRRSPPVTALAWLVLVVLVASPALALDEADRLWMVAERAYADGLHLLARRTLERFVTQFGTDPRLADAYFYLGNTRLAMGDTAEALEAFERVKGARSSPSRGLEARFWEAETLFRLKRYPEARTAYEDVLRTNAAWAQAPETLYGLAWCQLEMKEPERAVNTLRDLLRTSPEHRLAAAASYELARALVQLDRPDEALVALTDFTRKYPDHPQHPDALYSRGRVLVQLDRPAEAVGVLNEFIRKHPGHPQRPAALYLLGWARVSAGEPREGLADLRAFVSQFPRHELVPEARRLMVQVMARHGDRDELQTAFRELMGGTTPEALAEAAVVAGKLGREKDQEAAWRKLAKLFPDHPLTSRAALQLTSLAFNRKDWREVISQAQVAARSDDEMVKAEAWLMAGEAELKLKRYATAVKAFENVGTLGVIEDGVRYRAMAGLGLAREAREEWREALSAYEMVAAQSPDSVLRDWAGERVTAIRERIAPPPVRTPANRPPDVQPAEGRPVRAAPGDGTESPGIEDTAPSGVMPRYGPPVETGPGTPPRSGGRRPSAGPARSASPQVLPVAAPAAAPVAVPVVAPSAATVSRGRPARVEPSGQVSLTKPGQKKKAAPARDQKVGARRQAGSGKAAVKAGAPRAEEPKRGAGKTRQIRLKGTRR